MKKGSSNADSIIGRKYNKLTIIGLYSKDKNGRRLWRCHCDCGGEVKTTLRNLVDSKIKDCGCSEIKDNLVGKKFGNLTVVKLIPNNCERNCVRTNIWLCKCYCGKELEVKGSDLTQRRITSCGCDKEEKREHLSLIKQEKKLYQVYRSMRDRCNNPNHNDYKRYGGRGIKVCEEWNNRYGFIAFYEWAIKNGYKDNLSLDRINNDGNYEPDNCRWATKKEQSQNTSTNVYAEYKGQQKVLQEWARVLNLNRNSIYYHYKKGRTIEEIVLFFEKKGAKHEIPTNKTCQMA